MATRHARVIILGSGPAGYTAALYAARAGHKPLLLTGVQKGGQLVTTSTIENWPAEHAAVLGIDLMERFEEQAVRFGTEILFDEIASVTLAERPFRLTGAEGEYTCDALIIATGAVPHEPRHSSSTSVNFPSAVVSPISTFSFFCTYLVSSFD